MNLNKRNRNHFNFYLFKFYQQKSLGNIEIFKPTRIYRNIIKEFYIHLNNFFYHLVRNLQEKDSPSVNRNFRNIMGFN